MSPRYLVSLTNSCLALSLRDSLLSDRFSCCQLQRQARSGGGLWGPLCAHRVPQAAHACGTLWQVSRCRMGWGRILLVQICPVLGLSISTETKVREAQQVVGKHTVFLPLQQGRESKGLTEATSHIWRERKMEGHCGKAVRVTAWCL